MTNYAIVGDGATGTTAAFYIRRSDPQGRIRIYSDDPTAAYYRAALTNYLMGELRADQLFAVPPNFYDEFKVERILARVNSVDTKENRLELSTGQRVAYDKLLIAAGARATMPPFPGVELSGVMTMRTMQDARLVMDMIGSRRLKRAIVVGGGILGLELVAGLTTRKVAVTWVIRGDTVVSPPIDRAGSDLVLGRCRHFGVDVRLNEEIGEVKGDKGGKFRSVIFKKSGDAIEAQLLAMSIGITPNIEFLQGTAIKTNRGVVVDDHLRSNIANVYAGGDIAEVPDPFGGKPKVIGLWEPARYHGRVAGMNMAGASETWKMEVPYTATRLYDLDVGAVGQTIEEPTDEVEIDFPKTGGRIGYRKLVLRGTKLAGALLVGTRQEKVRERARLYRKLVAAETDVTEIRDMLLDPFFDVAAWMDSQEVGTDAPRAMATIVGPAVRASLSTVLGKIPDSPVASKPDARVAARQTLSNLMRPAEGMSGRLAPPQPRGESDGLPSPSGAGSATLRVDDGRVVVIGDALKIGRSRECELVLEDDTVSGKHAEIARRGTSFVISDLGSRNGTVIDERKIDAPQTLRHGQVVALGNVRMTFIHQALPPRATMGPAGLPSEPLDAAVKEIQRSIGRIEVGGRVVEVSAPETSIGRDPDSDVAVDDAAVSWLHAQITRLEDGLYLRDLGSRNGTFVAGDLVTVPHLLSEGDVIHLGNSDLRFRGAARTSLPEKIKDKTPQETEVTVPEPASAPQGPVLIGKSGPVLGMSFALRNSMTLGRDPEAGIHLEDPTVSRNHARFETRGGECSVTDLGSTNGTFVGGSRIEPKKPSRLTSGDEIKVGDVSLVYETPAEAKPSAKPTAKSATIPRGTVRVAYVLVVKKGPKAGELIPIESAPLVIGRESASGVFGIDDQFVSSRHAEFDRAADGTFAVKDLESTNGTKVNGRRLEPGKVRKLKSGDRIQLGPETTIQVEMETR